MIRRNSEEGFRSLVENLSVGIVVHDRDTRILFSNQFASSLLGLSPLGMEGLTASDPHWRFIKEDGETIPAEEYPVNLVLSSGKPIKSNIFGIIRSDRKNPVWVLCNAYPELNENGEITQVVVNFTDISKEEKFRSELSELNLLFSSSMDQSQAGIAIADVRTGKLMFLNQAAYSIAGGLPAEADSPMDVDEFVRYWELAHLDGTPLKKNESPLIRATKGEKTNSEFIIKRKGFEERVIWANAAPILGADDKIMAAITIFLDTTDRYLLEKELVVAREIAEDAANMKERFLSIAAHELRNPISALSLLTQLTQKKLEKGETVNCTVFKKLKEKIDRISHLVADLLDVSRLERGVMNLNIQRTNITPIIADCLEDAKLRQPERTFLFDLPKNAIQISIDPVRIYQVISNLLENAVKYSPEETQIQITVETSQTNLRLAVTDQGPAISAELKKQLFRPFTKGPDDLGDKSGGLGLGLYICKSIIELHGGNIGVTSNGDSGNTFSFEIPLESVPTHLR